MIIQYMILFCNWKICFEIDVANEYHTFSNGKNVLSLFNASSFF